jgi:phosphinothricin acetyltransferase
VAADHRIAIRLATPADAQAIARIYNQGIEDRQATLETRLRDEAEVRGWLGARSPRHPLFVACDGGQVVGWASLNVFNPRPCYDAVADVSVYVGRERRGQGVGKALASALVQAGRERGFHKLVLAAIAANEAARRLYERAGFREVGVYREQGQLDGRWVDVLIMELLL